MVSHSYLSIQIKNTRKIAYHEPWSGLWIVRDPHCQFSYCLFLILKILNNPLPFSRYIIPRYSNKQELYIATSEQTWRFMHNESILWLSEHNVNNVNVIVDMSLNYTSFLINWIHYTQKSKFTLNVLTQLSGYVSTYFMSASSQAL